MTYQHHRIYVEMVRLEEEAEVDGRNSRHWMYVPLAGKDFYGRPVHSRHKTLRPTWRRPHRRSGTGGTCESWLDRESDFRIRSISDAYHSPERLVQSTGSNIDELSELGGRIQKVQPEYYTDNDTT